MLFQVHNNLLICIPKPQTLRRHSELKRTVCFWACKNVMSLYTFNYIHCNIAKHTVLWLKQDFSDRLLVMFSLTNQNNEKARQMIQEMTIKKLFP